MKIFFSGKEEKKRKARADIALRFPHLAVSEADQRYAAAFLQRDRGHMGPGASRRHPFGGPLSFHHFVELLLLFAVLSHP